MLLFSLAFVASQAYLIVLGRKGVKLNKTLVMPAATAGFENVTQPGDQQRCPLLPGDVFVVAGRRFQFEYLDDSDAAEVAQIGSGHVGEAANAADANAHVTTIDASTATSAAASSFIASQRPTTHVQRAVIPPSPAPANYRPAASQRRHRSSLLSGASSRRSASKRMHLFPAESAPQELVDAFEVAQQQEQQPESPKLTSEHGEENELFAGLGSPRKPGSRKSTMQSGGSPSKSQAPSSPALPASPLRPSARQVRARSSLSANAIAPAKEDLVFLEVLDEGEEEEQEAPDFAAKVCVETLQLLA